VGLALDPVMLPAVGPRNGQCVAVGLLPVVRVQLVLLPVMRGFLLLFTPTLSRVCLSLIVSEFAVKLCLILCKRKDVPWTPMSFVDHPFILVRLVLVGPSHGILSSIPMSGGPLFLLAPNPGLALTTRSALWT